MIEFSGVTKRYPGSRDALTNVTFSIAANTTGTPRNGTLTVAGQSVAVSQAVGATPPAAPTNLRIVR